MAKEIYVISPVRTGEPDWYIKVAKYIVDLEASGKSIYWPLRDTVQADTTGKRICHDNFRAIGEASEVHFLWDGQSQGSLFDLGIAFALGKTLVCPEGFLPDPKGHKTFEDMARDWADNGWSLK